MLARTAAFLGNLSACFIRQTAGSIAINFAIAAVPIVAIIGTAVDYSGAYDVKARLQAALDAAVLAGAVNAKGTWKKVALDSFNGNYVAKGSSAPTPTFTLSTGMYTGDATASVATAFSGIIGIHSIQVSAHSAAEPAFKLGHPACLWALNNDAAPGAIINGNAVINAPDCTFLVNSGNSEAVDLVGNASVRNRWRSRRGPRA